MASQPNPTAAHGAARTYAGQGYELTYFARKHGLTRDQARAIMRKHGHDRDRLNQAAAELKHANSPR